MYTLYFRVHNGSAILDIWLSEEDLKIASVDPILIKKIMDQFSPKETLVEVVKLLNVMLKESHKDYTIKVRYNLDKTTYLEYSQHFN